MGNRNPISGDSLMTSFLKIDTFNHQIPPSPPGFQKLHLKRGSNVHHATPNKNQRFGEKRPLFPTTTMIQQSICCTPRRSLRTLPAIWDAKYQLDLPKCSAFVLFFRILDELQYLEYHEMTFREKPIGFAIFEGKIQGIFYCNRWGDGHLWSGRNGLKVHWKNAVRPK